jgi:aminopeptidase
MDPRIEKLANNLIKYSCRLKKNEKVLIEYKGDATKLLAQALVRAAYEVGGLPFTWQRDDTVLREVLKHSENEQLDIMAEVDLALMKKMDAYIGVRGSDNVSELGDLGAENMKRYIERYQNPVHGDERVKNTKWVVLRYPNYSMAQLADMSLEAFEDFYFKVCNLDYGKMSKAMDSLALLMERTDRVHIKGKGTDLSFSIKDIPAIKCAGEMNIPDGEVFTAPVRDSVNGRISYNCPAVYQGVTYENIVLDFEKGKIVNAKANDTKRINDVFDTDDGARFVGEFAIGVNPYIENAMKDTLFDEKIKGSFHFTPGKCYEEASNGNDSSIHWDLVCIQRPEFGGGEIYFDDVLIRKDGHFVIEELECLNPENLSD